MTTGATQKTEVPSEGDARQQTQPVPNPPTEAAQPAPEPTPPPAPEVKPEPRKKQMATKTATKKPSNKAIVERARRMAKQQLGKSLRSINSALGTEFDSLEELESGLANLQQEREKSMTDGERTQIKVRELTEENRRLNDENLKLRRAWNKSEKERKRVSEEVQDLEAVMEIKDAARDAGVVDLSYAIHLFREHVLKDGEHGEDPGAFFETLKHDQTRKHLFEVETKAAGPSSIADKKKEAEAKTETAEETKTEIPPQGSPPPADPNQTATKGEGGEEDSDAFSMDKKDFNDYAAEKYGFRPSM